MCSFPFLHASTRFSRETSNHPCREPRVGGEFRQFSWLFLGGAQVQDTSGMATMEGIKFHAIRFWTFKPVFYSWVRPRVGQTWRVQFV